MVVVIAGPALEEDGNKLETNTFGTLPSFHAPKVDPRGVDTEGSVDDAIVVEDEEEGEGKSEVGVGVGARKGDGNRIGGCAAWVWGPSFFSTPVAVLGNGFRSLFCFSCGRIGQVKRMDDEDRGGGEEESGDNVKRDDDNDEGSMPQGRLSGEGGEEGEEALTMDVVVDVDVDEAEACV